MSPQNRTYLLREANIIGAVITRQWVNNQRLTGWLFMICWGGFDASRERAASAFATFCAQADDNIIWDKLTNQVFLGDEAFTKKQLMKLSGAIVINDIPNVQRRAPALPLSDYALQHGNRNDAILAAYRSGAYSMTQLAKYFQLHVSTVSKLVAKFKA